MSVAEDFEEFVAIVEAGSLTAAAEVLGLPRPTLSRRLARLEARLGVRLIHRTTRRMALSPEGERFYDRARRVVQAAHDAEEEVRRLDGVPRGHLRVTVPAEIPQDLLADWTAGFLRLWPEVSMECVATSEHVDLVAEGFDVAFRAVDESESLVVRTMVRNRLVAVASPKYLAARGTPKTPADLKHHDCIRGHDGGTTPVLRWPRLDGGSVAVGGRFVVNQMGVRMRAACHGLGIALVVKDMASEHLADGTLVTVLEDTVGRIDRVCLAYPERKYLDPKVRAFLDYMVVRVKEARAAR